LLLEEKRRSGAKLIDLSVTNPTEVLEDYPHVEIARAYGSIVDFRYEPEPFGSAECRQTIANWYGRQGISASPDRIALTASTSEAYSILFKLLCDPGDEVLVPTPSYPLFDYLARADAVKTVPYQLTYDGGWFTDMDSVRQSVTSRTKAIVIVNPNNPTGSFTKMSEYTALGELAAKIGLALISDEVFMTYPLAASSDALRTLIANSSVLSFSLNGLSKALGMPQMKLGWIVINGPERDRELAKSKLELLLDSYLSVGTPVQRALPALFQIGAEIQSRIDTRLRENRQVLQALEKSSIQALSTEGGWSAILQVPNVRSEDAWITTLLSKHNVVVQPGYFYDMPKEAYLVLSLLPRTEDFLAGINCLKRLAELG
jgi:hypothetical protein